MLECYNKETCTGCGACVNVCPASALSYGMDEQGYLRPLLDKERCAQCGRCDAVCPLGCIRAEHQEKPDCYAVMMDDRVRAQSSSGGVFPVLATWMLEKGGYVCGAAWGEGFSVHLCIINEKGALPQLCRSKYMQSHPGKVYTEIKELLEQGNDVLFCACPCQVAGLHNFLGQAYEKLYTIDFICTQAPTQALFQKYLYENFYVDEIEAYHFRTKDKGWKCDVASVAFKDGRKACRGVENDAYQQAYHGRLMTPSHCENCSFADFPRWGDITIGDFWWISEKAPALDDQKGTSALTVNSEKGTVLLHVLREKAVKCNRTPLEWLEGNRIKKHIVIHPERDRFYELVRIKTFNEATRLANHRIYPPEVLELPVKDSSSLDILHIDSCCGGTLLEQSIVLDPSAEMLELSGWAIDPTVQKPLRDLFVQIGSLVFKGEYGGVREDIATWKGEDLRHCGFYIRVPVKMIHDEQPHHITIATVGSDGSYRLLDEVFQAFYTLPGYQYDVGVFGCWAEANYGSEMTYFALYNVIKTAGFRPLMIERPLEAPWHSDNYPQLFCCNPYRPYEISPPMRTKNEMRQLNELCTSFLVGSDQMWHQSLNCDFGNTCFLNWVHDNRRMIAYATSFGREYWTGNERERGEVAAYLQRFDEVSVRERSGIKLCQEYFGVEAQWNIDPIFLCEKQFYQDLVIKGRVFENNAFIGAYILDVTPEKEAALRRASEVLGLPLEIITDARNPRYTSWSLPVNQDAKVEDWLRLFHDAEFIITDSFHGMCLSLLFEKPFVAIENEQRGIDRFRDYGTFLGINDRIVSSPEAVASQMLLNCPNYTEITPKIEAAAGESKRWLLQALRAPKDFSSLSTYDLLSDRLAHAEEQIKIELHNIYEAARQYADQKANEARQACRTEQEVLDKRLVKEINEVWTEQTNSSIEDLVKYMENQEKRLLDERNEALLQRIEMLMQKLEALERQQSEQEMNIDKIKGNAFYRLGRFFAKIFGQV